MNMNKEEKIKQYCINTIEMLKEFGPTQGTYNNQKVKYMMIEAHQKILEILETEKEE